jgi:serine/threonine protein kinase
MPEARLSRQLDRRRALTDPLLRVAGPDPDDLRDDAIERTRYAVMGMSVCITAAFATGVIPVALSMAAGRFRPIYLLFGFLWGLFVFNLDRWVVSTFDYKSLNLDRSISRTEIIGYHIRRLFLLAVRLTIAVLIGLSISEPIVMLIYSSEITAQISQDQAAGRANAAIQVNRDPKYSLELAPYAQALDQETKSQQQASAAVTAANKALDAEEGGYGGTRDVGVGPRAAERRTDLHLADAALALANSQLKTAQNSYNDEESVLANQKKADLANRDKAIDAPPGLLDRAKALSELAHNNTTVNDAWWELRGLILLIDVAPVLLKLASPGTAYERVVRTRSVRKVAVAEGVLQDDVQADLQVAGHARKRRIEHETLAADLDYEAADDRLRVAFRERDGSATAYVDRVPKTEDFVTDEPSIRRPSGNRPPGDEQPGTVPSPHVFPTPPAAVIDRLGEGSAHNILGKPGKGIEQYVGGRWKIGAQLPNADPALAWRTPYLAEDVVGSYEGYAALKKVHPPNKTKGIVEALQEVTSLPHGKEVSPYIAPIIDGGIDREFGWYVVTPYYENGTLQRRMKAEQPLTLGTALTITEQILSGLLAAFTFDKKNLVHFDIKPSNIAFDNEGNVRIIDWGLSEVLNPDYQLTISGSPRYTLWYAPPEQVLASPERRANWTSPLCDIRAVGAVLYAMITGRPPFHVEAGWAGMLDDAGNLNASTEKSFKELLENNVPLYLEEFFTATPGWDAMALHDLSELVAAWLDPVPAARTPDDWTGPAQQIALEMLQNIVADLRSHHAGLLAGYLGAAHLDVPGERAPRDGVSRAVLAGPGKELLPLSDSATVNQTRGYTADFGL